MKEKPGNNILEFIPRPSKEAVPVREQSEGDDLTKGKKHVLPFRTREERHRGEVARRQKRLRELWEEVRDVMHLGHQLVGEGKIQLDWFMDKALRPLRLWRNEAGELLERREEDIPRLDAMIKKCPVDRVARMLRVVGSVEDAE